MAMREEVLSIAYTLRKRLQKYLDVQVNIAACHSLFRNSNHP
jgi:hypothetical protein